MKKGNITAQVISKVRETLNNANVDPSHKVIVGVSGGCDSMTLLHILAVKLKMKVVVVHVNHNLRGTESDLDEQLVIDFCKEHSIKLVKSSVFPEKDKLNGESTEMACRRLRHNAFEYASSHEDEGENYPIILAHNANDQVETMLYKLCRSSNVGNFAGMQTKTLKNGSWYFRPLLGVERKHIEEYARFNKIPYRNDSSNSDIVYKRNFIRKNIIPLLLEVNSNAIEHFCDAAQDFQQMEAVVENEAERYLIDMSGEVFHHGVSRGVYLDLNLVNTVDPDMKSRILFQWLNKHVSQVDISKITKYDLHQIFAKPKGNIKKTIRIGGVWFTIYKGYLFEEAIVQSQKMMNKLKFF